MTDMDAMRAAAPRPQYPPQGQNAPRPNMNPVGPGSGMRPMANQPGQQPLTRPQPPPLRRMDSKGNVLMNPGPQQTRPPGPGGVPQQNPQNPPQMRPQSGGPLSPTGQNRPTGPYPWAGANPGINQPNRPNMPNQQARPPFPQRPTGPGQVPGQPQQQFRPPFPQQQQHQQQSPSQMQQQQQQQQQHHQQQPQQQQHLQQQQRPMAPAKPNAMGNPSLLESKDDDDDVVIGQATTPLKNIVKPSDPMTQSHYGNEDSLLGERTDQFAYKPQTNENHRDQKNSDSTFGGRDERSNEQPPARLSDLNIFSNTSKPPQSLTNFQKISGNDNSDRQIPNNHSLKKGDNDSGVDESTQGNERNGPVSPNSPDKSPTKPTSGISRPPSTTPSNKSSKSRSTSRSRLLLKTPEPEPVKKVPMNKIQVGSAPSPNLKAIKSKIGSLDNATYKPGGGNFKIESKKIDIKAAPRIEAKNEKYMPKGGDKKIVSTKLQWNAKSKIGSLENASHKPGGGDKKIETLKHEFKDKAKPKIGSKDNVKHTPGGGDIKIQTHKIEIKAQSKIGSLDNVKHKPGGGDKKIFDDKEYLKNVEHPVALSPPSQSPVPSMTTSTSGADENLNQQLS